MRELLREWLEQLQGAEGASPHTRRAYEHDVDAFLTQLQKARGEDLPAPSDISPRWIRRYLGQLMEREGPASSRATMARRLSALKAFFRYLVDVGVLDESPAESVEGPRGERKLPEVPSAQELAVAFDQLSGEDEVADARDRALLELLYGCGLRVSEAVGLDVKGVDLTRGWVRVLGKRKKERTLPLGEPARAALRRWLDLRSEYLSEKSGLALLLGKRGARLSSASAYKLVRSRLERAGVSQGLHPHALRHAFATHMLEAGADISAVKELLGHESLSTTQIYTHVTAEHLKKVHAARHPRASASARRDRPEPEAADESGQGDH